MEKHGVLSANVLFMKTIDHVFKSMRFLLSDGEGGDSPSKPARLRLMMRGGFVDELKRVFALDYSDESVLLKGYYLDLLVEVTKDNEHIAALQAAVVTDELVTILKLGAAKKFKRIKVSRLQVVSNSLQAQE
jgi:hypothetical protein